MLVFLIYLGGTNTCSNQKIDFAKDDYGKIINSGFALQYNDCMVLIGLGEEGLYVELIEKEDEDELI